MAKKNRKRAPKHSAPAAKARSLGQVKKKAAQQKERRPGRHPEVLGALTIAMAIMLALAIISHNPADNEIIADRSFWQLFFSPEGAPSQVTNGLGAVGAYLSQVVIDHFFGMTTLILNGVLSVLGYIVMRRKSLKRILVPSGIALLGMGYLAILLARLGQSLEAWESGIWAGMYGEASAQWMVSVLGSIGSYGVLAIVVIVGLLLVADGGDIQRTLDRIESAVRSIPAAFKPPKSVVKAKEDKHGTTSWEELDPKPSSSEEQTKEGSETQEIDGSHSTKPQDDSGIRVVPRNEELADSANGQSEEETASDPTPPPEPPTISGPDPPDPVIVEEEPFNVPPGDIELKVYGQVEEKKATSLARVVDPDADAPPYSFPSTDLLDHSEDEHTIDFDELEENKRTLLDKLAVYRIEITDINAVVGPTVTLYELKPAAGVKINQIKSRENDLAMAMAAGGIRMIAPIPNKSAVGVEIPNRTRELVRVHQIIGTEKFAQSKMALPVALGKTIEGEVYIQDLAKMPHLLIAGATGSGKSVGLNALITGLLYACHPSNLKFVMIDPKKIELQQYRDLHNHFLAIPEDGEEAIITEVQDALSILKSCLLEMEARYDLLSDARVRSIQSYNAAFRKGQLSLDNGHKHLPYIVVIIDELADLMMTAGKDIEGPIARLAQMARAVGIHLVLATQRPSVDVITGLIKANFPSRVAFRVASKIDARTILDQNGAEQLVGNGDMLYMSGSLMERLQGPFVSDEEIDRLMDFIKDQPGPGPYRLPAVDEDEDASNLKGGSTQASKDKLFNQAARIIVRAQQGSVSLLQRRLSIGYTRAARLVDQMENLGIVGSSQGAKARKVLVADEQQLESLLNSN